MRRGDAVRHITINRDSREFVEQIGVIDHLKDGYSFDHLGDVVDSPWWSRPGEVGDQQINSHRAKALEVLDTKFVNRRARKLLREVLGLAPDCQGLAPDGFLVESGTAAEQYFPALSEALPMPSAESPGSRLIDREWRGGKNARPEPGRKVRRAHPMNAARSYAGR